jgi:5'-phosphate synthase pdxT subunit
MVEQGNILAATFHPELSADRRVHQRFIERVLAHSACAHASSS